MHVVLSSAREGDKNFCPLQQHKTNLLNVIKGFKIGLEAMIIIFSNGSVNFMII